MSFPATLYLAVFFGALIGSAVSVPLWIRWSRRQGWLDDPGHRKIHLEPVPLAGGLAVFTGMAAVLVLGAISVWLEVIPPEYVDRLGYGLGRRAGQLAAVWAGAIGMLLLGWMDDQWELSAARKFLGQTILASMVAAAGVRVTLFVPYPWFSHLATVLWILTVTNALNFTDNMNGLCAGLGILGSAWFGSLAALHGQYLVASLAFLVTGALAGFLPFNYPRARVFLGDAGSHLVGFWLAVLAILPHFYSQKHPGNPWAVLSPLLILAVPLLDLSSVVWLRTRAGRPFWIGDTQHFSHRLVRCGLSKSMAVFWLWVAGCVGGALSLWLQA